MRISDWSSDVCSRDLLALIARIDAECTRADEAETRVEEIELDAEKVAAEFEGDATKALGRLANVFDEALHEWAEQEDGWVADNAETATPEGRAALLRRIDAEKARADAAEKSRRDLEPPVQRPRVAHAISLAPSTPTHPH